MQARREDIVASELAPERAASQGVRLQLRRSADGEVLVERRSRRISGGASRRTDRSGRQAGSGDEEGVRSADARAPEGFAGHHSVGGGNTWLFKSAWRVPLLSFTQAAPFNAASGQANRISVDTNTSERRDGAAEATVLPARSELQGASRPGCRETGYTFQLIDSTAAGTP